MWDELVKEMAGFVCVHLVPLTTDLFVVSVESSLDSVNVINVDGPLQNKITEWAVGLIRGEPLIDIDGLTYLRHSRPCRVSDAVDVASLGLVILDQSFTEEPIDDVTSCFPERMFTGDILPINEHTVRVMLLVEAIHTAIMTVILEVLGPVIANHKIDATIKALH
jgi:hypothetical protein